MPSNRFSAIDQRAFQKYELKFCEEFKEAQKNPIPARQIRNLRKLVREIQKQKNPGFFGSGSKNPRNFDSGVLLKMTIVGV